MSDQRNVPATVERPETAELPALIRDAGGAARLAFEEFFHGQIRNPSTRKAYLHTIRLFSDWCGARGLKLVRVTPADVGRVLDSLPVTLSTRKLHLAALRRSFDGLVMRHILILNLALSVRSERFQVVEGKTPEITVEHARRLLKSIAATHDVGRRDFAVIGILIYTAARVGAVAKLRQRDFYEVGDQFCLRFHKKGGKVREIPVRHDLQLSLNEYLDQSGLRYADPSSPLFRTAIRRTKRLTTNPMTADDMARTYLATAEGWVYLAVVLDLFSRKVVGWALSNSLATELVSEALRQAVEARRPEGGELLHHSDRGCQYTSDAYQQTLRRLGLQCSTSRTGCCYDNAVMERFFWSLKHEWTNQENFGNLADARLSVFRYIETFYNPDRLHQTLGYLSPNQFEAEHAPASAA